MEEVKLTVEKTEKKESKVDKAQLEEALNEAKAARDEFANELNKKVYLIAGKAEVGNQVLNFLESGAKWTSQESLGVVRAHEDLTSALKGIKRGELYLHGLCIEAVAYFLSKADGMGLEKAIEYRDMFTPVNAALGQVRKDQHKLESLDHQWNQATLAFEQGVTIE